MTRNKQAKSKLIYAMDYKEVGKAYQDLEKLREKIGAVKIGKEMLTGELFNQNGLLNYISKIPELKIMIDLKFNDIPDTVYGAAAQIAQNSNGKILGFTMHCLAGREAMREAVRAVKENFNGHQEDAPLVMAVTVLTSLDRKDLYELGFRMKPETLVRRLATIAYEEGVPAIVCSPKETSIVLDVNPQFIVLNPGIRFTGSELRSQKRVTSPMQAISNGASYIVMGSDLRKGDPCANARKALQEISLGLHHRAHHNR